jgi:formylglycine-generating enzyme required for sulfatase activity
MTRPMQIKNERRVGASRRLAYVVVLIAIGSNCYGTPRTSWPDEFDGGSDGQLGGDAAAEPPSMVDASSDTGTDADGQLGGDAAADVPSIVDASMEAGTDAEVCSSGTKPCAGKCIPAVACCGPCSCDGLPRTCGPNRNEDCCASVLVPGGTFDRDNDATYPATVGDFHLDRFEITVGRFNRFVAADQGLLTTAPQAGSGKNESDPSDPGWLPAWNGYLATNRSALATNVQCPSATFLAGDDGLPMNCITWYEAFAFCIWDGGRLPTEAEWTYAAAGGGASDGQRIYPWSMPPSSATIDSTYAVNSAMGPTQVGSRSPNGDGKWKQADLVGNVGEWVADYVGPYPIPCFNCTNRVAGERRVIRGGDWALPPVDNTSSRAQVVPDTREGLYGARCARR